MKFMNQQKQPAWTKKSWKIIDECIKCVVVIHSIFSYQNKKKYLFYIFIEKSDPKKSKL